MAREDAYNLYVPRGEGAGSGWIRIGRYDTCRRRALWVRFIEFEGPVQHAWEEMGVETIELCAGREGDDAYVKITAENQIFHDLLDCVGRAADHIPAMPTSRRG